MGVTCNMYGERKCIQKPNLNNNTSRRKKIYEYIKTSLLFSSWKFLGCFELKLILWRWTLPTSSRTFWMGRSTRRSGLSFRGNRKKWWTNCLEQDANTLSQYADSPRQGQKFLRSFCMEYFSYNKLPLSNMYREKPVGSYLRVRIDPVSLCGLT